VTLAEDDGVRTQLSAAGRLLEFAAYKLLIVLTIVAVGNSSPTIREVMDALRG
jgi:hypothetical protein